MPFDKMYQFSHFTAHPHPFSFNPQHINVNSIHAHAYSLQSPQDCVMGRPVCVYGDHCCDQDFC